MIQKKCGWAAITGMIGAYFAFAQAAEPNPAALPPASTQKQAKALPDKATQDKAQPAKAKADKEKQPPGGKFLRVIRNDKGQVLAMETSIARYTAKAGPHAGAVVDLISAVHIGEKEYYEKLNKAFTEYEALLYELVAPEGTRVPKGGGERRGILSGIQGGMKDLLGLDFQLEQVDYTKENFVHADLSPEKFSAAMDKKGESMLGMLFKLMGQSMAMQAEMQAKGQNPDVEIMLALFDQNRPLKLRRALAGQFENMDAFTQAMGGPNGSTIIEGRNAAALEVLAAQLKAGKKKIAIFYGAGHMPSMEKQMSKDFQLAFEKEDWLEAWNMRDGAGKPAPAKKAPAAPKAPAAAKKADNQASPPTK